MSETADVEPVFALFCFFMGMASTFVPALTGFGAAIVLLLFWRLVGSWAGFSWSEDVLTAVRINVVQSLVVMWPLACRLFRKANTSYMLIYCVLYNITMPLGTFALVYLPTKILTEVLGYTLLCCTVLKGISEARLVWKERSKSKPPTTEVEMISTSSGDVEHGVSEAQDTVDDLPDESEPQSSSELDGEHVPEPNSLLSAPERQAGQPVGDTVSPPASGSKFKAWVINVWRGTLALLRTSDGKAFVVACLFAGFLGGLLGLSGVPLLVYWAFWKPQMDAPTMRATSLCMLFFGGNIPRIGVMFFFPGLDFPRLWPLYAVTITGGTIGSEFGQYMHKFVDTELARRLFLFLLLLACISMLSTQS